VLGLLIAMLVMYSVCVCVCGHWGNGTYTNTHKIHGNDRFDIQVTVHRDKFL